eukprot:2771532-Pyramimonas_sp.AAC.1
MASAASAAKGRRPTVLSEPDMAKLRKLLAEGDKEAATQMLDEASAQEKGGDEEEDVEKDEDAELEQGRRKLEDMGLEGAAASDGAAAPADAGARGRKPAGSGAKKATEKATEALEAIKGLKQEVASMKYAAALTEEREMKTLITLIPTKRIKAKEFWEQSKDVEKAILSNGPLKDKVVQAFANQAKNEKKIFVRVKAGYQKKEVEQALPEVVGRFNLRVNFTVLENKAAAGKTCSIAFSAVKAALGFEKLTNKEVETIWPREPLSPQWSLATKDDGIVLVTGSTITTPTGSKHE